MKTLRSIALLLALFVAGACTKPAGPTATFDIEKAKVAIAEVNQKLMDAVTAGDSSAFASMYHSQALVMPANDEAVSGTDKIASSAGGLVRMGMLLKLTTSSVWGNADLVVEEGGYEMTDKSGAHIDHGKYIVLWKEEGGQWKLYRDIWNSSMPMPLPSSH